VRPVGPRETVEIPFADQCVDSEFDVVSTELTAVEGRDQQGTRAQDAKSACHRYLSGSLVVNEEDRRVRRECGNQDGIGFSCRDIRALLQFEPPTRLGLLNGDPSLTTYLFA